VQEVQPEICEGPSKLMQTAFPHLTL
jgi:hypothetical protein